MRELMNTLGRPSLPQVREGWVLFHDITWDDPRYHEIRDGLTTKCGLENRLANPIGGIRVPLKHARRFATPCINCYGHEGARSRLVGDGEELRRVPDAEE